MRFAAALLVATLAVTAGAAGATVEAAKPHAKRKRCEVVVFKRRGKTIRRCRLKRGPVAKVVAGQPPAPAPPGEPPPAVPEPAAAPAPPASEPPRDEPAPASPRDPWFFTLHARDVGNGDFRLLPRIGSMPAGTLYLSYKNEDATEHDLRLRGLNPARAEQLIFPASSTQELRETTLVLEPGRYEFRCGLLGHEDMKQSFDVTP